MATRIIVGLALGPAFLAEDLEDGVYLSDHYPVGVELELS